jgi:16S rRNA U516 pseudouridylate synthase RsuA-like enzyme
MRISNIKIGNLKLGSWRHLTNKEKTQLLNRVGLNNPLDIHG